MAVRPMKVWNAATSTWDDVAVSQRGDVVLTSLVSAKGQIIGASGPGTPAAVPAGTDGHFLIADSASDAGVKFANEITLQTIKRYATNAFTPDDFLVNNGDNANGPVRYFDKSRGSVASPTSVSSGDRVGQIQFRGHDGTAYRDLATVAALVDTTPGANDMPGRLSFQTTADGQNFTTERMRIDSTGRVQIPAGGVLEAPLVQNARTDSYTLVLADAGKLIEMGKATAQTLTIPANASVAFPVGTKIDVLQTGAGETTIAGAGGVTINSEGSKLKINAQWQAVTLIKRATDTWVVIGALKA